MCQVSRCSGREPKDWVIVPIHNKGDRSECTNYRGISLLSLPGKLYAKCLEERCREIIEPELDDTQCGFRPGGSTTEQIFTLQQIFEKSLEYAEHVYTCFVDLEKAYDRVLRKMLWGLLREYGVDCILLLTAKSLYFCSKVCVLVGGVKSQTGAFKHHRAVSFWFSLCSDPQLWSLNHG